MKIWLSEKKIAKFRDVIWTLRYNDVKRIEKEINEGRILPRTFSKKAYDIVGGFNPKAGWAIDTFFNRALLKQGYILVYEPRAIWWHKWREDLKVLWKYSYKFGKLNTDIIRTDKKQWLKIAYFFVPFLLIILGFFNPSFFYLLLLHPFFIFVRLASIFFRASGVKHRNYIWYGIIVSYVQNIPYSLGFIRGLIR